jgi:integrase
MAISKRKPAGTVAIEIKSDRLRLRLPRTIATGSRRYISTKWVNSPDNYQRLQVIAWQIETDIKEDRIATTLQGYIGRFKSTQIAITPTIPAAAPLALAELWDLYCEYKKPQLAVTTYTQDYRKKYLNHISNLPQSLDRATDLRNNLIAKTSIDTAKRVLTAISACCSWAVESSLIEVNPFMGMVADLKRPKTERSIDPFTATERESILQAFQNHPDHQHYYHFVRFLFLTGCRTGEAIALQWQNVADDLSSITFAQSYSSKLKIRKCTKTGTSRKFPVNADLLALLVSIKPANAKPTDLVFTSPAGLIINNGNFTNRVWAGCKSGNKTYKGILTGLIASGAVTGYRCPYNTRHTFITMMLAAGLTCSQVASLVGNSPAIILKHYAGGAVDVVPRI